MGLYELAMNLHGQNRWVVAGDDQIELLPVHQPRQRFQPGAVLAVWGQVVDAAQVARPEGGERPRAPARVDLDAPPAQRAHHCQEGPVVPS